MYRFPWYLTLVSTNHASSNPGQGDRVTLTVKFAYKPGPDDDRIVSHDAFSRSIMQYCSHGRFHHEIRSFSPRLFSHSISSKSKKIALFHYLT